ncbi:MAG: FAD-dependent thymidylate synthase [Candidatus Neomarinimicrobiota bacterium]|nr:FAD-dependent thymidylate synthase [Candidatus Neomarinimicrobiota bacterium]MEC9455715.1 FAD-dependent thymidylate synthase [Candidatus Neomarinimicrobiota bacterium]MED5451394.1 FAD-dependent thymidylate synthase [Candidatus Neomarinimicrobiota bacterium]MEE3241903.1 FAD-dependent thymidylate synthase [Candidatus Neomarinimicrobiota bacterium]MEE3302098.1 FAD-dependent thymidylate synthase [Candidatus Neomarinimicrobiota bacterium]
MKKKVLDKGYIELIDTLGDDLTPVNAARVSFDGFSESFTDKDRKLSKFLIKHKHFSPFRHQHCMFIIKAPEFVMRQWYKHVVGIETTSNHPTKDHAWNEISGRYVPYEDFYKPTEFRKQSENNKQASEGLVEKQSEAESLWKESQDKAIENYEQMLELGMAKEQARSILPLTVYTKVWWTASFQSIMNFIELRDETTSQVEIQEYARALKDIMLETFPETTKIWFEVYSK